MGPAVCNVTLVGTALRAGDSGDKGLVTVLVTSVFAITTVFGFTAPNTKTEVFGALPLAHVLSTHVDAPSHPSSPRRSDAFLNRWLSKPQAVKPQSHRPAGWWWDRKRGRCDSGLSAGRGSGKKVA